MASRTVVLMIARMAGERVPDAAAGLSGARSGKGDGVLRLRGGSEGGEDDADRVGARSGALAFDLVFALALSVAAFFAGLALGRCFLGGDAASLSARRLRLEARVSRVGVSIFS